jgi:hypothetical protein
MSGNLRALFGLPPLPGKAGNDGARRRVRSPSSKELPKLLARAQDASAQDDEWLQRTRDIVRAGALATEKDFDHAARILLASDEPDDLLAAHVLAMCLAFTAKDEPARRLCAETLDRFLLSIGRPQRFDTVRQGDVPKEPRATLQGFILEEYGVRVTAAR